MIIRNFEVTGSADGTNIEVPPEEDLPPGEGDGSLLVLVEALDREGRGFKISGVDVDPVPSRDPNVQMFAGIMEEFRGLSLRLISEAGRRFRVFVGWIRGKAKDLWNKLSCEGCVLAIRAAVKAGLAAIGVPFLDGDEIRLGAHRFGEIANLPILKPIIEFFERLLGEGVWSWLWGLLRDLAVGALDPLVAVLKMANDLYRHLCRRLGLC